VWIPEEDDETTLPGISERTVLDLPDPTPGLPATAVLDLPRPRAPMAADGTDDEEVVSIGELLDGGRSEAAGPPEVAIVRLASLLGISAVVVAVMILIVVVGVDVGSLFRSLPVT
jgi:hypothetical protein